VKHKESISNSVSALINGMIFANKGGSNSVELDDALKRLSEGLF